MPEYYGGAPNAFAGGMEYGAAMRRRRLNENALNALISQYGPEAADPVSAAQMQTIAQRAATNPLELADAQRVDAARRAAVVARGVGAGDPAGEIQGTVIEDRALQQKLHAGQLVARVLKHARANGGDVGKAFDMSQNALSMLGIVPDEHMAEVRAAVAGDPESADEFIAALSSADGMKALSGGFAARKNGELGWATPTESGMRFDSSVKPVQAATSEGRLGVAQGNLGQRKRELTIREAEDAGYKAEPGMSIIDNGDGSYSSVPTQGSVADLNQQETLEKSDAEDRTVQRAYEDVHSDLNVMTKAAEEAIKYFSDADGGLLLQNLRRGAPIVPGTRLGNAYLALTTVKNNTGLAKLAEMRKSSKTGASGMGQLSGPELIAIQNSQGNLSQIGDPTTLVETLQDIVDRAKHYDKLAKTDADISKQRMAQRSARFRNRPAPSTPASGAPSQQTAPSGFSPEEEAIINHYVPR